MSPSRREFLTQSIAAGSALAALPAAAAGSALWASRVSPQPLRLRPARALRVLILGGTNFVGPHLVRDLLERGHAISIFTRGRRTAVMYPELFDRVEHLEGDRENDLDSLRGKRWDAVIDNSGQRVEWARASATLLAGSVSLYMYVSSTGVFLPYRTTNIPEDGPIPLADNPPQDPPSYGVMKALSEIEVRKAFPAGAIIIRPTYIVGPGDSTDRFPYWPVRIAQGGEVLVPGRMTDPVQYIDVRDLSAFMVHLLERGTTGTFNVAGPHGRQSMAEFVYGVRAATTAETTWTWIEDYAFLEQQRLRFAIPWLMLTPDYVGSAQISNARAIAAGLRFRALAGTVEDTLAWWYSGAVPAERRASPRFALTAERENEILVAWRAVRG